MALFQLENISYVLGMKMKNLRSSDLRIQWFFSFFRSSLYVYRSVNDSSNSFVDNLFRQLIFFQNENWYHRYKNRTIKKIERRKSIKGIVEIGIFRYGYTMRLQYACLITIALNQDTKISPPPIVRYDVPW